MAQPSIIWAQNANWSALKFRAWHWNRIPHTCMRSDTKYPHWHNYLWPFQTIKWRTTREHHAGHIWFENKNAVGYVQSLSLAEQTTGHVFRLLDSRSVLRSAGEPQQFWGRRGSSTRRLRIISKLCVDQPNPLKDSLLLKASQYPRP